MSNDERKRQQARISRTGKIHQTYGLTPEGEARLYEEQSHRCAICRDPPGPRGFHLDHCHATGVVRGLLCPPCNVGLGQFRDSPGRLWGAIDYLVDAV